MGRKLTATCAAGALVALALGLGACGSGSPAWRNPVALQESLNQVAPQSGTDAGTVYTGPIDWTCGSTSECQAAGTTSTTLATYKVTWQGDSYTATIEDPSNPTMPGEVTGTVTP